RQTEPISPIWLSMPRRSARPVGRVTRWEYRLATDRCTSDDRSNENGITLLELCISDLPSLPQQQAVRRLHRRAPGARYRSAHLEGTAVRARAELRRPTRAPP